MVTAEHETIQADKFAEECRKLKLLKQRLAKEAMERQLAEKEHEQNQKAALLFQQQLALDRRTYWDEKYEKAKLAPMEETLKMKLQRQRAERKANAPEEPPPSSAPSSPARPSSGSILKKVTALRNFRNTRAASISSGPRKKFDWFFVNFGWFLQSLKCFLAIQVPPLDLSLRWHTVKVHLLHVQLAHVPLRLILKIARHSYNGSMMGQRKS